MRLYQFKYKRYDGLNSAVLLLFSYLRMLPAVLALLVLKYVLMRVTLLGEMAAYG